jgi:HlyD family secretion protein
MIKNTLASLLLAGLWGCQQADGPATGYQGVIELDEVVLAFDTSGRIERVSINEGDRVALGTVVASLDDDLLRAHRLALSREAEALRAQADLTRAGARREDLAVLDARARAAQATEDLFAKNLERERALFQKNVVPAASIDQVEAELARARAERESAEAQAASLRRGARREERTGASARAEAAEAQIAETDQRISRMFLRAPRDGAVLEVHVEPGEVATAGMPIATLGDPRRPRVDVFVPQGELSGVVPGATAEVKVDAEAAPLLGQVEYVARELEFTPRFVFSERERAALVARVRVRIDDAAERLHAGTPAFVSIQRKAAGARP